MPGFGCGRAMVTPYATIPRRQRFTPWVSRAGAGPRIVDSVVFVMDNFYELARLHDCNLNASFRLPRCGVGYREYLLSRNR